MLQTTRAPFVRRTAALAVGVLVLVTGCSSGGTEGSDAATEPVRESTAASSDASVTPSPSPSEPTGPRTTPPGTELAFGETAKVAHEVRQKPALLALTVESATQGSLDDLEGFALDDPYKRRGTYYYVRVAVRNAGKKEVGGVPVPLWGVSGKGMLLRAVRFQSAFATCPTEPLPEGFGPGDRFETCLVYLSPDRGTLAGVSYRPAVDFQPIQWRGKVKPPATKRATPPAKGTGAGEEE